MTNTPELKNDLSSEFSDLMYLINKVYTNEGNITLGELEAKLNSYIDSRIELKR